MLFHNCKPIFLDIIVDWKKYFCFIPPFWLNGPNKQVEKLRIILDKKIPFSFIIITIILIIVIIMVKKIFKNI